MADRRTTHALTLGISIVLGLGILVLVNYIGSRRFTRFDWTRSKLYSLSEKTTKVLAENKTPVKVTVFVADDTSKLYTEIQELLRRYQAASPLVSVETLDPTRNPAAAESLVKEFTGFRGTNVVFRSGEKKKLVTESQLAEYDYTYAQYGGRPTIKAFKGEQEFTSAILSVTAAKTPKILFTTAHGERKINGGPSDQEGFSAFSDGLKGENATTEEWQPLGAAEVPPGTDCVVVAGPRSPFTEPEVDVLLKYLAGGGRVALFLDPEFGPGATPKIVDLGLGKLFQDYGVVVDDSVVVDPKMALPRMGAETFFAMSFKTHPITKPMMEREMALIFRLSRSVRLADKLPEGFMGTALIETSADAWGETDIANLDSKVEKDDKDLKGPVALAVAVEGTGDKKPRLVVVGDSDCAGNSLIRNAANQYLAAAITNWLLDRDALIAIPPKSTDLMAVTLTRSQVSQITIFVVILLPLAAIVLGLIVWIQRRR